MLQRCTKFLTIPESKWKTASSSICVRKIFGLQWRFGKRPSVGTFRAKPAEGKVSTFSFNKQIFAEELSAVQNQQSRRFAAYISSQKFGLSDKTEAIILNNANDIVGKFILPQHRQFEKLTELLTIHAGTGVILYGNNVNEQMYKEYRDKLELMGFTALDAILLESGNYHSLYEKTKINVYDHLLDKFSKNHLNAEPIVGVSENNLNNSYSKNFRNMEEPPQRITSNCLLTIPKVIPSTNLKSP
jgi:hypothetical protein